MIKDGLGVQLVPWQPVLEKRLDHYISGVRRDDGGIDWEFSRKRQIGRGLSFVLSNTALCRICQTNGGRYAQIQS